RHARVPTALPLIVGLRPRPRRGQPGAQTQLLRRERLGPALGERGMRAEQVEEGARAAALGEREALRELVQRQRETDLVELLLALEERGAHLRLLQLPPDRLRQLDRLPRAVERLGGCAPASPGTARAPHAGRLGATPGCSA